jgi:ABC-2 type transport system permease protein
MTRHPVFLVASREIAVRLRSKAFRITTLISVVGLIGFMGFAGFRAGQTHEYEVAHTPDVSAVLLSRLDAIGKALDAEVRATSVPDREAVLNAVSGGDADLGLAGLDEMVINRGIADQDISPRARFLAAATEIVRTQRGVERAGLSPDAAADALSAPPPEVTALKAAPPQNRGRAAAFFGILFMFFMIQTYASWVSLAVVREKTTRLAELLLVTLKPRDLLLGKLLGVATLAFSHASLLALVGLGTRSVIGGNVLADFNLTISTLLWPLAWFFVGFALYASLYAAAGAMVRNAEDGTALPLFSILMLGYITASTLLTGGEASTYHRILAWFPLTAPFDMLGLIGIGAVSTWQALSSLGLAILAIPLTLRLAGGIYAAAVVRTGQRVKWSQVLRPGGLRRTPA